MALSDYTAGYKLANANDETGSYNLTAYGSPTYVSGKIGNCANFDSTTALYRDGTDQCGGITYANSWGTWAFSMWIKATSLATVNQVAFHFENNNGAGSIRTLYVCPNESGGGKLQIQMLGTAWTYITGPTLSTGTWYHVVVSMSSGTATLYVNGISYGTGAPSGQFSTSRTGGFGIGAARYGNNSPAARFNGVVDACYIWTHALTTLEIASLYNAGSGQENTFTTVTTLLDSIVGAWNFTDGSGTTVTASVGSNGTITNTDQWSTDMNGASNKAIYYQGAGSASADTRRFIGVIGGSISGTSDFSISFWTKYSASGFTAAGYFVGPHLGVAASGSQYEFAINLASSSAQQYYRASGGTSSNIGPYTPTLNAWMHLVVTYVHSTKALNIYKNGNSTPIYSGTFSTVTPTAGTDVGFPSNQNSYGTGNQHLLTKLFVWPRAITTTEVSSLYNGGIGLDYPFSTTTVATTNSLLFGGGL